MTIIKIKNSEKIPKHLKNCIINHAGSEMSTVSLGLYKHKPKNPIDKLKNPLAYDPANVQIMLKSVLIQVCQKETPRYLLLKLKQVNGEVTVETDLTGPMVQYENTGVKKIAGYFIKILNVFLIPIATTKVKST